MKIGAHVSNRGPDMLEGAVREAVAYGANCLMIYLGPPQNSYRKSISEFKISEGRHLAKKHGIAMSDIIVHAPYIINLARDDSGKRNFAIDFLTTEIVNAAIIGVKYYVFHPGNHLKLSSEAGVENIADSVKKIIRRTDGLNVVLLAETMSGKGSECCFRFKEMGILLNKVNNNRLRVCLDTCHIHDAGYDLSSDYEGVIREFSEEIGLENLAVLHVNDSKNEKGRRRDRHENIGYGKIGFEPLLKIVRDARFKNLPKILETPYVQAGGRALAPYGEEIKMLKNGRFNDFIYEMKKG